MMAVINLTSTQKTLILWGTLIGLILLGTIAFLLTAFRSEFKTVHQEMISLAADIRQAYKAKPDYWGLNTDKVVQQQIVPQKMLRNQQIISSLGREIIVGGTADGETIMPGNRYFMLTISDISRNVCIELAKNIDVVTAEPSFDKISIHNEESTHEFTWGEENSFENLKANVKDICRNRNQISWTFN